MDENTEIAAELLRQIAEAAQSGNALALGPQAVRNLNGLLLDLLIAAKRSAVSAQESPLRGARE